MEKKFNTETIAPDSRGLRFLYRTVVGRVILSLLTMRFVSKLVGWFLDTRLSRPLISRFIKRNNISGEEFEIDNLKCFNDCFVRRVKEGKRPIEYSPEALIAPCDGRLSAYRITEDTVLPIKQSSYTVSSLLGGDEISKRYENGVCLVYRLCVDNYHRYCYIDAGSKGKNVFIKGKLHTVRPVALESRPVFTQNCREYTVMETENFGTVTQVEVGAMLVGKIKNHHEEHSFLRGEEKGLFLYGGSTIVVLLEDGAAVIPEELFKATERGEETLVKYGEQLGTALRTARKAI